LLELKFKELILTIADNPGNRELLSYFCSLLSQPQTALLQRVMEDNFCYNLKLENYAKLSNRSLSAFKRDFEKLFGATPGKWLLEKRLQYSLQLLMNRGRRVSEARPISAAPSRRGLARRQQKCGVTPIFTYNGLSACPRTASRTTTP
jgi:AraC-like DNA-binding protein